MTRFPAAVNCSMAFTHLPLLERPAAARAAGWERVEFAWPFTTPTPDAVEVTSFDRALDDAGVELLSLNFYGGDLTAGDRGFLSWPDRREETIAAAALALEIGARHACRVHNTMYGNRRSEIPSAIQDAAAEEAYAAIASIADHLPSPPELLIEPISDVPSASLPDMPTTLAVIDRVAAATGVELGVLADSYHLAAPGHNLRVALRLAGPRLRHVQLADRPGRGAPGTGAVDFAAIFALLDEVGYTGPVALEFLGDEETAEVLAGMPDEVRDRLETHRP